MKAIGHWMVVEKNVNDARTNDEMEIEQMEKKQCALLLFFVNAMKSSEWEWIVGLSFERHAII